MTSHNLSSSPRSGPTVLRWINRLVTGLLRSTFHALLSHTTLLLTFTGRKSGRRYTIPVRYLLGGAPVDLYIARQKARGRAEVNMNLADVEQEISAILRQTPSDARFYRVHFDRHGQPDIASLKQATQVHVLITIQMENHT